jgi:hypothetical protein
VEEKSGTREEKIQQQQLTMQKKYTTRDIHNITSVLTIEKERKYNG